MVDEYLKKDTERVQKKYSELMHNLEIDAIEKKIESLNNNPSKDSMDMIWLEIYTDVLDLKKKYASEEFKK
ncbi:MAG: hypothetical protein HVN35_11030 [Methanobacteriaceae archaeon]|nr:hypothetical protein [Methanobacteriaceae archaeon]